MSDDNYELPVPASGLPNLRVAILGAGKMGGILLQAFLKNNLLLPEQLVATVQHPDRALALPRSSASTSIAIISPPLSRPTSSCSASSPSRSQRSS